MVSVPGDAQASTLPASKALAGLPERPSVRGTPTVVSRYWTVDSPAADVFAWLGSHDAGLGSEEAVGAVATGDTPADPVGASAHYRGYTVGSLPASIAFARVYVGVAALAPGRSAVAVHVETSRQPKRPAAEVVPTTGVRAVVGWSLAPGGTPVRKPLTGERAATLARDFNALRVATSTHVYCPMILSRGGNDVTVTFTAAGSTWQVDIPICPAIRVTRGAAPLPDLKFGQPFLRDVSAYAGHLPWDGPPAGSGGVTPLTVPPSTR